MTGKALGVIITFMKLRNIGKASNIYEYRGLYHKRYKFETSGEAYHQWELSKYKWKSESISTDFAPGNEEAGDQGILG